jgi:PhnB protein
MAPDPLDALRQPDVPRPPRAAFAADLRRRLAGAFDLDPSGGTMTNLDDSRIHDSRIDDARATAEPAVRPRSITPYLHTKGAARAIDFYRDAFGAVETFRMEDEQGRIGHAELDIDGVVLMLADEHPEHGIVSPATLGGAGLSLTLPVDDVDGTYERAVAAGARGERPPADQFYGERSAVLLDPFGHRWTVSHPVEQVPLDELARRATGYVVTTGAERDVAAAAPEPPSDPSRPVDGELGYFTLAVPDVDRAATFYGALFGWDAEPARPSSAAGSHRYRHVGNTSLPFGFHDDVADPTPHHYYRVADIAPMAARVRELGGEVLSTEQYASGGSARCRDDQGVEFDLWQPAPGY